MLIDQLKTMAPDAQAPQDAPGPSGDGPAIPAGMDGFRQAGGAPRTSAPLERSTAGHVMAFAYVAPGPLDGPLHAQSKLPQRGFGPGALGDFGVPPELRLPPRPAHNLPQNNLPPEWAAFQARDRGGDEDEEGDDDSEGDEDDDLPSPPRSDAAPLGLRPPRAAYPRSDPGGADSGRLWGLSGRTLDGLLAAEDAVNLGRGTGFRIDASLRNLGSSVDMVQECALHMSGMSWKGLNGFDEAKEREAPPGDGAAAAKPPRFGASPEATPPLSIQALEAGEDDRDDYYGFSPGGFRSLGTSPVAMGASPAWNRFLNDAAMDAYRDRGDRSRRAVEPRD